MSTLTDKVKNIIKDNIYLTLATSDDIPWATPLYYCTDDEYNFYFISQLDSLHTKHIVKNPTVAFAIFDSTQKEGAGTGIQASGKVYMLDTTDAIQKALKFYHTSLLNCTPDDFVGIKPYRLFKLAPEKIYIQDPDSETDKRIEVSLKNDES